MSATNPCDHGPIQMKRILIAAMLGLPRPGAAEELIECKNDSMKAVVSLNSFAKFGRMLSCVRGPFINDLTPCAPNGEFGLSYRKANSTIVDVVSRSQDYSSHVGGVTSHYVNDTEIYFSGGFNSPDVGYDEAWSIRIDRLNGTADLTVADETSASPQKQKGGAAFKLNCRAVTRKF